MELTEHVHTGADPAQLYELVADLATYPEWLGLVVRAVPDGSVQGPEPAWIVELRGRIGPFARSKRLRMVRTVAEPPVRVRFERIETDRHHHSVWHLEARVEPTGAGAILTMDLYYGGNRFAPVLTPVLREEIRRGRRTLQRRYPVDGDPAET